MQIVSQEEQVKSTRRRTPHRYRPIAVVAATFALVISPTIVAPATATEIDSEPVVDSVAEVTVDPVVEEADELATEAEDADVVVEAEDDDLELKSVPVPGRTESVITVRTGGVRSSAATIGGLPGVQLGLFRAGSSPLPVDPSWGVCTADADGDCSFTVPNTHVFGENRNARFWVKEIGAAPGYYANPWLGTGSNGNLALGSYRFRTGLLLQAGQTYTSTADFMRPSITESGTSTGTWMNSMNNPSIPQQCGLKVGLLLDLSGSLSSANVADLKTAGQSFVNALTGTPSEVAVYTMATQAPAAGNANLPLTSVSTSAGATIVNDMISGVFVPSGNDGATNWDRGLYQAYDPANPLDVAVLITDGMPTQDGDGSILTNGTVTRFREVENGIASANTLKSQGTRVIALGVGAGVSSQAAGLNLRAISGTVADSDYFRTEDYSAAEQELRELARGNCASTVTVVKQTLPATTPVGSTDGATLAGGWEFTAVSDDPGVTVNGSGSGTTVLPSGAVNFPVALAGGVARGAIDIVETAQDGYVLHPVDGANATCVRTDTGDAVSVTDLGTDGFTVDVDASYPVSCTVYNRALPDEVGHLTLVKEVDNQFGGTSVPSDWTLRATPLEIPGQEVIEGNGDPYGPDGALRVEVAAGDYALFEFGGPSGYDTDGWVCDSGVQSDPWNVTVGIGDDIVCTVTNHDLDLVVPGGPDAPSTPGDSDAPSTPGGSPDAAGGVTPPPSASPVVLATTGSPVAAPLAIAMALILLGGAVVTVIYRRRMRVTNS